MDIYLIIDFRRLDSLSDLILPHSTAETFSRLAVGLVEKGSGDSLTAALNSLTDWLCESKGDAVETRRSGAEATLDRLAGEFGDELESKLPKLWQASVGPLQQSEDQVKI